jgi:hypothetical protein
MHNLNNLENSGKTAASLQDVCFNGRPGEAGGPMGWHDVMGPTFYKIFTFCHLLDENLISNEVS